MGQPFLCAKCGTVFAADSVGVQAPAISKCTVCGTSLTERRSAQDPIPSRKGEFWLWMSSLGPGGWIGFAFALGAAALFRFA